jgi:hypothetical protein
MELGDVQAVLQHASYRIWSDALDRRDPSCRPLPPNRFLLPNSHGEYLFGTRPTVYDYFFEGTGAPLGSDDLVAVPRFWMAAADIKHVLSGIQFEEICAHLDIERRPGIGLSLRTSLPHP